ncbi:MAG: NAD-dependent epimerase/dehydratase family protein [Deltaproteobacteria bacterium]|nr:NAD-dependent epimerase/dehydratase family protein [Deltaproteobacteria bacterium]
MNKENKGPYLVTGAAGFTGGHMVRWLAANGYSVRVFVRDAAQFKKLGLKEVEIAEGDLKNEKSIRAAIKGTAGVFHIAALFRKAGLPDSEYYEVNVEGTRRLLNAAVEEGVPRFIHCSTIGVQGHIENPPAKESDPYNPGDIYQVTKMEAEKLALRTFKEGKIRGVVIRPAMIYGPGDTRLLKLFSMLSKGRFFYVGAGDKYVHFIDVRDLVAAFGRAMELNHLNAEVYTIGGKRALPLNEAVEIICEQLGVRRPWLHLPVKPVQLLGTICEAICTPLRINPPIYRRRVDFFTKDRHFDCSKARQQLGFQPSKDLEEEIADIIDWYYAYGMLVPKKPNSSTLLRTVEGKVTRWDTLAEKTYGFSKEMAEGNISHDLFKTEFPCSLEQINRELLRSGSWKGPLVHTKRDGSKLRVESRWELRNDGDNGAPYVLEINLPDEGDTVEPILAPVENVVGAFAYPFSLNEVATLLQCV